MAPVGTGSVEERRETAVSEQKRGRTLVSDEQTRQYGWHLESDWERYEAKAVFKVD